MPGINCDKRLLDKRNLRIGINRLDIILSGINSNFSSRRDIAKPGGGNACQGLTIDGGRDSTGGIRGSSAVNTRPCPGARNAGQIWRRKRIVKLRTRNRAALVWPLRHSNCREMRNVLVKRIILFPYFIGEGRSAFPDIWLLKNDLSSGVHNQDFMPLGIPIKTNQPTIHGNSPESS